MVDGGNRFEIRTAEREEMKNWEMSLWQADRECMRRAIEVYAEYPFITIYCFLRSAAEHCVHPGPKILDAPGWRFRGDSFVLGVIWCGYIVLALSSVRSLCLRGQSTSRESLRVLCGIVAICCLLTLASGLSFGQQNRLRAPLDICTALLAGIGVSRAMRSSAKWGVSQSEPFDGGEVIEH